MVIVRESCGATCTTYWLGSSPAGCTLIQIATTLSDTSNRLPLLSSHSMSCCIDGLIYMVVMVMFIMVISVLL
jgi:hypothetical protein